MTLGPIRTWLLRFAQDALHLREFTAFLGVTGDLAALRAVFTREDSQPGSGAILGVNNLRWVLFQPGVDRRASAEDRQREPFALLLSFVHDGEVEDALDELADVPSTREILSFCHAFDGNVVPYLEERRVKSGFMFRDPGPLRPDEPGGYRADASRRELEDAMRIRTALEAFHAQSSARVGQPPGSLRERFLQDLGPQGSFPFTLNPFERRMPDEERLTRRLSEVIRRVQVRKTRERHGEARRGAHAKGHGVLRGSIRIDDAVPAPLAKGLFAARGQTFQVTARASNSKPGVDPDDNRDVRGFALSVELPLSGPQCFARDDFLQAPDGDRPARQDFVLFSDPEFFAANVEEAVTIFGILSMRSTTQWVVRLLAWVIAVGAWRQLWIGVRALWCRVAHPLETDFHSGTPYLLGDDHVVKYSLELRDRERLPRRADAKQKDYLADALGKSLGAGSIELDLYVHAVSTRTWLPARDTLVRVIEDASASWGVLSPRKVRVATVRFDPQVPETAFNSPGERWRFNPWNALKAHRPLGNINRARRLIMNESVEHRSAPAPGAAGVAVAPVPVVPRVDDDDDRASAGPPSAAPPEPESDPAPRGPADEPGETPITTAQG